MIPASGKCPYNGEKRLFLNLLVNQISGIVYYRLPLITRFVQFVKTGAIFIKKQDYLMLLK